MDRQVRDEDAAMRWLTDRREDLRVPLRETVRWKTLPTDHPVVAAILRYAWPRGDHARRVLRAEIWKLYGEDLDRLLRLRVLTRPLVARLLHATLSSVASFVYFHFRDGKGRPIKLFRPRKAKAHRTKQDAATLAAIEKTALPVDLTKRFAAIVDRAELHLPAVEDMISRQVLSSSAAATLLGLRPDEMLVLRAGVKEGVPALRLLRNERTEIPDAWWKRIDTAYAGRTDGEARLAFCCRMIKAGFPGSLVRLRRHVNELERKPKPEMSAGERALVAALSALALSKVSKTLRAERDEAVLTHLASVDALVTAGKVGMLQGAALLGIGQNRFNFFRAGLRAGLTVAEVVAAPSPVPEQVWSIVAREYALAAGEPRLDFYWRMRAHHGFTGGERLLSTFLESHRLHEAALTAPPAASAAAA
jgi:hypothetical protein